MKTLLRALVWLAAFPLVAAGADDPKPAPKTAPKTVPATPTAGKDGTILSDPRPEAPPTQFPARPPAQPADPSKPRTVKIAVGELAKLTARPPGTGEAAGDAGDIDLDKYAFLWQFPDGLNARLDSNRSDAYVAAGKQGTFKVAVFMARNGTIRPDTFKAEILVVVGETGQTPGGQPGGQPGSQPGKQPQPGPLADDIRKAKEAYPNLIEAVKALAGDADAKKAVSAVYLALAAKIRDGTLKTDEDVKRELNAQLTAPATTANAAQALFLAVSRTVNERVTGADTLGLDNQKLLFLALGETLAGR